MGENNRTRQLHETVHSGSQPSIEELKEQVVTLRREKLVLENRVRNLGAAIENLQQYIEDMKNSVSWKVTDPFRKVLDFAAGNLVTRGLICVRDQGLAYSLQLIRTGKYRKGVSSPYDYERELAMASGRMAGYKDLTASDIARQKQTVFKKPVKISLLVPLYNTPERYLKEMIISVLKQTYSNWELCLADGSDNDHAYVGKLCRTAQEKDSRIRYKKLEKNLGISDNTNVCISMASGDYIALFDHDDKLTPDALFEVVRRINDRPAVDVLYTDEDKVYFNEEKGKEEFSEPYFKCDFNLDLLRSNNYICHLFVVSRKILDEVGGFRKEFDGSQDYDFILRCTEKAEHIEHIPQILYHWRIHSNSTSADPSSKLYCYEAGRRAIEDHLRRTGTPYESVEMLERYGHYRVRYPVVGKPLVSIIIPNMDNEEMLRNCIGSIQEKSTYRNYEIIVVENNSTREEIFDYYKELDQDPKVKVVFWEKTGFNYSALNNFGIRQASGEYLLFLNNDMEVITETWIEELLSMCQRRDVGITGAKLIYPDNTVQHCGVVLGLGGVAGHVGVGIPDWEPGYFGRAFVQQDLSAVTAACLMISAELCKQVGGFNEELGVNFNDVDFCLKVREAGYLVTINPKAMLYHYESRTRGKEYTPEKRARLDKEADIFAKTWPDILAEGDPYYSPNLSLNRGDYFPKLKGELSPEYV